MTAAAPLSTDESKDRYFARVAELSQEMIAAHGKDFAMGTLVLAARWIAENRLGPIPAPTGSAPAGSAPKAN